MIAALVNARYNDLHIELTPSFLLDFKGMLLDDYQPALEQINRKERGPAYLGFGDLQTWGAVCT